MLDLSIIIVSFNTKNFLKKCLESIVKNTSNNFRYEIIVVDNASVDGALSTLSSLKSKILNLKIIKNQENVGFSKANNIGVKEAMGKYILFLNSDTEIIQKHTLEEMAAFMDFHIDAGAATCYVELPDKKLDDAAHRGFPTPWNAFCHFSGLGRIFSHSMFFNGYHLGWKNLYKVHEIDSLAGAFMIVRRDASEQVGWWDEDYFFYGEDLDFCYKLKKRGWKIYFVPTIKILHYKGISSGIKDISKNITTASSEGKKRVAIARFDAMKIFYKKHYLNVYSPFITNLVLAVINVKKSMILFKYK